MQKEKTTAEKIFTFVASIAICALIILDGWALIQNIVTAKTTSVPAQNSALQADETRSTAPAENTEEKPVPKTEKGAVLSMESYVHELGAYGFSNDALVPTIAFSADGTFVFRENTGSGMGTCTGSYTVSKDGTTVQCTVTSTDIVCPDVITFTLVDSKAIQLGTTVKKSVAGDSFVVAGA